MKLFYEPEDARLGDIIPFYEDGVFKPFYLGNGWCNVSTKDHLHFYDAYSTGIHGGTGSIVKVKDIYHMFYCKFTFHPVMRQYACHATSPDLRVWTEHPEDTFQPDDVIYEMSDWRDPHVIWNEEEQQWWMLLAAQQKGKTMRKGCVGLCVSKDFKNWEYRQPLYAPATHQSAHECPDIFRWGDWWYLVYSAYTDRFQTLYRMSKSLNGPWITPEVDTFDTRSFYAGKTGTNGIDHFIYAWNPKREKNIWKFNPQEYSGKDYNTWDWGGTMIVHKLIQQSDGTLAVTVPEAVDHALTIPQAITFEPLVGDWKLGNNYSEIASPYGYTSLLMNRIPSQCKLEFTFSFKKMTRQFGVAMQVDKDFAMGYYMCFEPSRGRVQYKTGIRMYEDGGKMFPYEVEQERPIRLEAGEKYRVRIFIEDSILLMYVDDKIAFSTRMFDRCGYYFGLFASEGEVKFENIRMYIE